MPKSKYKKMQRLQERLAKTSGIDTKINPITAGWVFNKWYEKIIFIALAVMGFWKLFEILFL